MKTICRICPHNCSLNEGESGKCLVRKNVDGIIRNEYEGICSIVALDAIEKRPFFHFYPGSKFLSVGFFGCNASCPWCQSHEISQSVGIGTYYSPQDLLQKALEKGAKGIVFTYNEPLVHYEYIVEVARRAKLVSFPVAIKSNGFINSPFLEILNDLIDGWNIDLKGNEAEYNKNCGIVRHSVMETVKFLANKSHLEISYLIPPALIDNTSFHEEMCNFLASLSPDIPVHLLYFYPFYKMESEFYEKEKLLEIHRIFSYKMNYVYISNLHDSIARRNTYCPVCSLLLISRSPFPSFFKTSCCDKNIAGIFG